MMPDPAVNIWAWTKNSLYPLYKQRAEGLIPEMDCHAQAAEIYRPYFNPADRILDAGGGSGYFYWSLKNRDLLGRYHLLDQTADFVDIGRKALADELSPDRFIKSSIQRITGQYEIIFCVNALFCLPDYRQGLERMLTASTKMIILRTTLSDKTSIRYETDLYLDPGAESLKSYFNIWTLPEVEKFIRHRGFTTYTPVDIRTNDQPEISAGKIFPWRWLVGVRD